MPDETKDFAYYAELAEEWLAEARRVTPIRDEKNARFDFAMMAADVYSRLAAAVPKAKDDA